MEGDETETKEEGEANTRLSFGDLTLTSFALDSAFLANFISPYTIILSLGLDSISLLLYFQIYVCNISFLSACSLA